MLTSDQTKKNLLQLAEGYDSYNVKLNLYAHSRMHSREVSEDLVQDAFKKAWLYLMKGGKIQMMESFLYHVLRHLIIDTYRKHKSVSLDLLLEKGFDAGIDESERLLNIFDGKEAVLLIKRLPLQYRKVVYMKYVQGLSLQEISDTTGQTKNTVAVQAHRGLLKMRELYRK